MTQAEAGPVILGIIEPVAAAVAMRAFMARLLAGKGRAEKARGNHLSVKGLPGAGRGRRQVPYCQVIQANGTNMTRKPSTAGFSESASAGSLAQPAVRLDAKALAGLARHGYSEDEVFALVVPKRTLARRRAANERLTVEETDKALRLQRIAAQAERVFGAPEKARRWLRKAKRELQGETPLVYLASEAGARVVEEMLFRIEHGMFA
jgi:putative toxin-antitoxin system antitoxin component (TIGR02293 family)